MGRKRDLQLAREGVETFLRGMGYGPDEPTFEKTASRVVDAWVNDLVRGELVDLEDLLRRGSEDVYRTDEEPRPFVVLRDIETVTMCPHHLLPALGTATVVYRPGARLAGLGTIARLVDACSRRLVLQEQIGQLVVDALVRHLGAQGALCRLSFSHTCLVARGEKQRSARADTLSFAGTFSTRGAVERELALAELYAR